MPSWVLGKVNGVLNKKGLALRNTPILVLGIAYKKDVDDLRESPGLEILNALVTSGAQVSFADPFIASSQLPEDTFGASFVEATEEQIRKHALVVIATAHSLFDYEMIKHNAKHIVDTRGVYSQNFDGLTKA